MIVNSLLLALFNVAANSEADSDLRERIYSQLKEKIASGEVRMSAPSFSKRTGVSEFSPSAPIIGGTPAGRNEFPEYTLVILTDGRQNIVGLCGGTVIGSNKVLTAAHCSQNRASTYFVIPDFYSFNEDLTANNLIALSSVVDHPQYRNNGSFDYDVAIMTMRQSVSIRPAAVFAGDDQLVGNNGLVIGTGLTATTPNVVTTDILLKVSTPVISNQECSRLYRRDLGINPITSRMVCAGFLNSGEGSCNGDSGGPLYASDGRGRIIIGLVSFGPAVCEAQRATSAYARTSSFTAFIKAQAPNTRFRSATNVPTSSIISLLLADEALETETPQ